MSKLSLQNATNVEIISTTWHPLLIVSNGNKKDNESMTVIKFTTKHTRTILKALVLPTKIMNAYFMIVQWVTIERMSTNFVRPVKCIHAKFVTAVDSS